MSFYVGETPIYDHLKIFGSLCYAYRHQRQKENLGQEPMEVGMTVDPEFDPDLMSPLGLMK